ncbi:N-acyl-D-glutamate deacylase [Ameyamaea chiangmaiensis NBRC 103196]|uniref:Amidohydrolase family protein n=1 Tax=Ameyamaea chiangmaiensis TaxID=442969 RepID=A0A850PE04_9PROT|nr:amidohydrolase family protein [Ameyamaea chiangmaiensis]MBS4075923.1 amidohydrolase family protein [Ameyamaea chiangmaiensis]NVN40172.1 amidohydrolase family protein [Ameyamaea chiangmaiensis]GBQ61722.1 N-acyl-D-glutamate deacylase [Ameyamaea chiangmaiensis NBRC 103196]
MPATIYRNALLFDGSDALPVLMDVAVRDGRIAALGRELPSQSDAREVACDGLWLMPGLLDIHTHLDLEVELAPGLGEVVRHGTTTVVMSNCSIGITYGHQRRDGEDPIVDCFARVENMPRSVLTRVADTCTWTTSQGYLDHLESLPLGPNVVPMIPHSMLRIEVMGLTGSITRRPSRRDIDAMAALLEQGMAQGFAGFSTDALPFHFLANAPNKRRKIPTQYAPYRELRRLTGIVRRYGRLWQATPPKDDIVAAVRGFLLTSGRLHRTPLRTTVLAALDLQTNRAAMHLCLLLSRILNSRLVGGQFRFQALSSPFRIWSDGAINPVADEVHAFRALNELELDDRDGRRRILDDPEWVRAFRTMWLKGKTGLSWARLMRALRLEHVVLTRNLADMTVAEAPLAHWAGETLERPWRRLRTFQATGGRTGARDAAEAAFFATCPDPINDDAAFFLHLLRAWDTDLRWETVFANRNPKTLRSLLFHPQTLPGFNDSGAHLANIGFYDGNLRTLKIAQAMDAPEGGLRMVARAVHRLTGLPAAFFGLNTGRIVPGAQADLCLIDPVALSAWDPEATHRCLDRAEFSCRQVVNRPDGVVRAVMVGGTMVWEDGAFTDRLGTEACGRVMRGANHPLERARA